MQLLPKWMVVAYAVIALALSVGLSYEQANRFPPGRPESNLSNINNNRCSIEYDRRPGSTNDTTYDCRVKEFPTSY